MIVYGDRTRCESPQRLIDQLREDCELFSHESCDLRVDRGTALLIASGELWQGLLDNQAGCLNYDEWTPLAEHCATLGVAAAALATGDFSPQDVTLLQTELAWLGSADLPAQITIKTPEGYAYYALYPRLYAMAAQSLRGDPDQALTVIGLRSIGTSLAAIVARSAHATSLPVTVRPQGHPFHRRLNIGPRLAERLLRGARRQYALVDEGPGLSGSSFFSIADWLIERGIREEQLILFPGHAHAPGNQATPELIARWHRMRRRHVDFPEIERDVLQAAIGRPSEKTKSIVLEDLGAGRWRRLSYASTSDWPAVHVQHERRKYLVYEGTTTWLAKFAGLGRYGRRTLARANTLASRGLIPPVCGLQGGFLLGKWLANARPLTNPRSLSVQDRGTLVDSVARHLDFIAQTFSADRPGASVYELWEMARINIAERFESSYADEWNRWKERLGYLSSAVRPVDTDNKLQPWEWLRMPGGSWLKADALDHHADHQFIGSQDIAWDVAGAVCELHLNRDEIERLEEHLAIRGLLCHAQKQRQFYQVCYLAFQMGYCTLAASSLSHLAEESQRLSKRADSYANDLIRALVGMPAVA